MSVNSTHPDYDKTKDQWIRCRDVIDGTDSVKEKKHIYLPKLSGQSPEEYSAYLDRALFFGATGRTVQGLMGAVFRKNPTFDVPEKFQELLDVVTVDGFSMDELARLVVRELLSTGRIGVLVDVDEKGNDPYVATYRPENVINWKVKRIKGRMQLVMVVLKEKYNAKENDTFKRESAVQYRVLSLDETGLYKQDVYRKPEGDARSNKEDEYVLVTMLSNVYPTRQGAKLDYIPFQFINSTQLTYLVDKPPLLDLVDVNLSHYRTSADLEHGAHYTALPTAWVAGFDSNTELKIGSSIAWVTDNPQAKAGFLEYTGQGLGSLSDLKKDKEQLMAVLGARLIESGKKGVEAAETHKLRMSGEAGALLDIVYSASEGLRNSIKTVLWWAGLDESKVNMIEYEINTDFISVKLTPQEITALMQLWQQGGVSQETFLWNLQQGEILPKDTTIDDEKDRLDSEAPSNFVDDIPPVKQTFNVETDDNGKALKLVEQ